MGLPVVTVAAGGLPIVESTVGGTPVTESTNGYGVPVTKVISPALGLPVVFETIGVGPGGPTFTMTWSTTDKAAMTLSNADLTATASGFNAGIRASGSKSTSTSGKYYWEATMTWTATSTGVGLCLATTALTNLWNAPAGSAMVYQSGIIWINSAQFGLGLGTRASGDVIGIAIDFAANLIWFRVAPSGNWNASGTANPATGTGGHSLSTVAGALFPTFGGDTSTNKAVANFGASAFTGSVPAGFTSGWPA